MKYTLRGCILTWVVFESVQSIGKAKEKNEDWEHSRQGMCESYPPRIKGMSCSCLEHFSARNLCETYVSFHDLISLSRCVNLEFCHEKDMLCQCKRNVCAIRMRCYDLWKGILATKYIEHIIQWMEDSNNDGYHENRAKP